MKITLGAVRSTGVHGLLIYCSDYHCSHSTAISADQWPDHIPDLEQLFVCQACAQRGRRHPAGFLFSGSVRMTKKTPSICGGNRAKVERGRAPAPHLALGE
jgi:hypothetical protein